MTITENPELTLEQERQIDDGDAFTEDFRPRGDNMNQKQLQAKLSKWATLYATSQDSTAGAFATINLRAQQGWFIDMRDDEDITEFAERIVWQLEQAIEKIENR